MRLIRMIKECKKSGIIPSCMFYSFIKHDQSVLFYLDVTDIKLIVYYNRLSEDLIKSCVLELLSTRFFYLYEDYLKSENKEYSIMEEIDLFDKYKSIISKKNDGCSYVDLKSLNKDATVSQGCKDVS